MAVEGERADMSRVSSRASIVAAVISIVLLIVVLLVMVLWTGARTKKEEEVVEKKSVDGLVVEVLESLSGVRVENASSTTVRGVRMLEEEGESFSNEGKDFFLFFLSFRWNNI